MALYSDPTNDGRVQREAASLAGAGYDVTVYALNMDDAPAERGSPPGVEIIGMRPAASSVLPGTQSPFHPGEPGTSTSAAGGRLGWIVGYWANLREWGKWAVRSADNPAVWHAHDLPGLLGLAMGGVPSGTPIVYDSHELYLESGSAVRMPRPARFLLRQIERRLARRAAGVITVNAGIAHELSRRYGVDPVVVRNCPSFVEVARPGRLRAALRLAHEHIVLYHGAVISARGIETMIDAIRYLPTSIAVVVLGNGSLVPYVQGQMQRPELADRLFWHPAVPQAELLSWVVDADVGCILNEPTELNQVLSSPNKLYECLTAGVPMVASDLPEIHSVVLGERVGLACDPTNPLLVAEAIRELLAHPEELAAMRQRAIAAARSTYNWDAQEASLLELYGRIALTGRTPA
jgi:glycosyltransferase involved in cell wall biosynthesis